jgi:acyl-CoA synthetase (AMP-forming)/AMP-acid ligase II
VNAAELLLGPAALRSHGERLALICGEEAVSYAELARRVRASAAALRALGVRPGERVALLMRETPECAAAWLGAVYAGAAVVSLNPRAADADCRHVVADSGARLALVEDSLADAQPGLVAELASTGRLVLTNS